MGRRSRLSKEVVKFNKEQFYVYTNKDNSIYQLRDINTQVVITCSPDLDTFSSLVKAFFNRYNNYSNYVKAYNNLSEPAVSENTKLRRAEEFKLIGYDNNYLINHLIPTEELNKEKVKHTINTKATLKPKQQTTEAVMIPTKVNRKLLKKRSRL